ncbi:acyl-CoA thioester hydrolase/BAAT C-terminal domain-containing protein [Clostridium estertheticum]|uniref:acyl-CoA thioester hydrolase/BAAT C-terminal domain-containing protein n=1 Tax=Clostridium estertheticum TaxID=238834 RepID=UPI001C6F1E40|nr:acyl-CoA thioester hydrolase/BAAT C-terminal domain-containing protein [Clostridium estertheticum]MBW9154051.1 acyl-CoA thioester hydrolase [Clostridium estertheticum]WLC83475.1 acyl-CoA thioester hydrolase [Clostridium estertheticum]
MQEYRTKETYGDFYENAGKPLVVILGGSRSGLPSPLSEYLLDYLKPNYNVLLLAYFGVGDLPKTLERISMEYFVNAISFVKEKHKIADNQVVIIGQSKGGEAALLLSNYMESAITIACVPSCYVFQGLPVTPSNMKSPKSSWSFNNYDLPYIKFYLDKNAMKEAEKKNYCRCYEMSIENNLNKDALININNYKGKILLLSAENDNYWPSKKMSNILVKNSNNKDNINHIVLELEGHYFLKYKQSVNEIINFLKINAHFLA